MLPDNEAVRELKTAIGRNIQVSGIPSDYATLDDDG